MAWLWNLLANKDKILIKTSIFHKFHGAYHSNQSQWHYFINTNWKENKLSQSGLNYVGEFKNNSCKNQIALLFEQFELL